MNKVRLFFITCSMMLGSSLAYAGGIDSTGVSEVVVSAGAISDTSSGVTSSEFGSLIDQNIDAVGKVNLRRDLASMVGKSYSNAVSKTATSWWGRSVTYIGHYTVKIGTDGLTIHGASRGVNRWPAGATGATRVLASYNNATKYVQASFQYYVSYYESGDLSPRYAWRELAKANIPVTAFN